ncbi:MAG: hypothetical protein ACYS8Y_03820 [Planctomycetota bacterium]|jgi:hypothetical protein
MSDEIEKDKTRAELENIGKLVDRYAQSRSLELLIGFVLFAMNIALILVWVRFMFWKEMWWWPWTISILVWGWFFLSGWLLSKIFKRYGYFFYREGKIKLEEEKIPIWAWSAYLITSLAATFLSAFNIMPVRWALVVFITSVGIFMLYVGKKQKAKPSSVVFAGLALIAAAATAVGVPTPFMNKQWLYSFFLASMIYIVGAGILAAIVTHIYNRRILRKIKEVRPFREQERNKSDS